MKEKEAWAKFRQLSLSFRNTRWRFILSKVRKNVREFDKNVKGWKKRKQERNSDK